MLPTWLIGNTIQVGLLVILCIGFTFTYMIEKFPNFAHVSFAAVGTCITFAMVRLWGLNPYLAWPVTTIVGGLLGVTFYILIVRPIKRHGTREITLTFAFFSVSQVIGAFIAMFSFWVFVTLKFSTQGFMLKRFDFTWEDVPGVMLTAPTTCAVLVLLMYLFLTRFRFGIATRAVAEDESLAASLGVDTFKIHVASWFIAGALSGLAGGIIPLWRATGVGFSDEFLISVMAGSVVGGLNSITGAVVGGVAVALTQKWLGALFISLFGIGAGGFEPLMPILFIFVVLMIEPEGITGFFGRPHAPLKTLRTRLRDARELFTRVTQVV
jgi:branched-chain amino acid transport system permease protein